MSLPRNIIPSFLAVLFFSLLIAQPVRADSYGITDLGTLGGTTSQAAGLNNLGQVVGSSTTASGAERAFLYSGGVMTNLGSMQGTMHPDGIFAEGSYSRATGINDSGQVVGSGARGQSTTTCCLSEITQGFLWENGTMTPLGSPHNPGDFNRRIGTSNANGINAVGEIAGMTSTTWANHGLLWQNGTMQNITMANFDERFSPGNAYGINNSTQVVGEAGGRAFLWQNGVRQDLGTLPGHTVSQGRAINDLGRVVGWSGNGSLSRAVLWNNGIIEELGALAGDVSSQALAINGNNQVVGWSGTRAFLWQTGSIFDLNDMIPNGSGWALTTATGINDLGQIVGTGLFNGQTRAFLLTLNAEGGGGIIGGGGGGGGSPMPEPGTLSLLTMGIAVGMRRLRGRKPSQAKL